MAARYRPTSAHSTAFPGSVSAATRQEAGILEPGAAGRADVIRFQRFAARITDELAGAHRAAARVHQRNWLATVTDDPLVTPLAQGHQHRPQGLALVGEYVVEATARLVVRDAFHHAVLDQGVQSVGQDVAGDAETLVPLLEASDA